MQQSDPYRATAASLAAQGHLLAGLVSMHYGSMAEKEAHGRKAVEYAQVSGDLSLFVAVQRSLAYTLYAQKRSTEALHLLQKAEHESESLFPFLRSQVLIYLAAVYGRTNHQEEATVCMGEARELFPEILPAQTPLYLSSDFGPFCMLLYEGKTWLELGQHDSQGDHFQQAESIFAGVENLHGIPERFRLEILNHRAETALRLGHLEAYMEQGIQAAQALGSQKRLDEVTTLYREVRTPTHAWHNENRVRDLADMLVS